MKGSQIHSVAVIGAGAVGAFYGSKLQRHGLSVQYHSATMAKTTELRVTSIWGDYRLPIEAFAEPSQMEPADLVIVSLKALPTVDTVQLVSPVVKKDSVVLLLQNGINQEENLSRQLSRMKLRPVILGGLAFACINRLSPSHIHHLDYGLVNLGALKPERAQEARSIVTLFQSAGIECQHVPDLRRARWEKLLWNTAYNTLSVLLHTNTDPIVRFPPTTDLSLRIMTEVQAVAAAEGVRLTGAQIKGMLAKTQNMKPYKTSMLLDYEAGRPLEVEAIVGEVVRMARKYHVPVPHLTMAYDLLRFLDPGRRQKA